MDMKAEDRNKLVSILRRAARQAISEDEFWAEFNALSARADEPAVDLALESATHYWGNFHSRNILLIPVKPNRWELEQGRDELQLIADGLEADWPLPELERRLKDI